MNDEIVPRTLETRDAVSYIVAMNPQTDSPENVAEWLADKNAQENLKAEFLLAHAEDGVIWGKFEEGKLITSFDVSFADAAIAKWGRAKLRQETLWQARIFGADAELLLWRDGDNVFHARVLREGTRTNGSASDVIYHTSFDEPQLLWGTDVVETSPKGFTLLSDGAQGLRHAVPKLVTGEYKEKTRPLRLWVRNYLSEDESGFNRVAANRLLRVEVNNGQA